jgi:hypothetical protein
MFKVGHVFSEVIGNWNGKGAPVEVGREVARFDDVAHYASIRCQDLKLEAQQWHGSGGRHLELGDGTRLERHSVYGLCDLGAVFQATSALIEHIHAREGSGRIWFVAPPSYLRRRAEDDDGHIATRIEGIETEQDGYPIFTPTGDGTRRVLIGAYYYHAPALAVAVGLLCDRCGEATGLGLERWAGRHAACSPPLSAENICAAALARVVDPLAVEYDGVLLRTLLDGDAFNRQEQGRGRWNAKAMTPNQRAAVSAHWSAQLRAKIAASAAAEVQRERGRVACDPREPLDLE